MYKFLLDTNIFNEKKIMSILREKISNHKMKIVISPITLLEYGLYQELHNKRGKFLKLVKVLKMEVEPINKSDAIRAIKHSMIYKDDERGPMYYFRDSLIAALSERLQAPLITNNTKNFKGLQQSLKLTSKQAYEIIMVL
jgi:predicted nucleic acid-binding protein